MSKNLKPLKIGKASSPRNAAAKVPSKSQNRKDGSKPSVASNGSDASESNQRKASAIKTKSKSSNENQGSGNSRSAPVQDSSKVKTRNVCILHFIVFLQHYLSWQFFWIP